MTKEEAMELAADVVGDQAGIARLLVQVDKTATQWLLRSVTGMLKQWPRGGGDYSVAREVVRLRAEAIEAEKIRQKVELDRLRLEVDELRTELEGLKVTVQPEEEGAEG